MDDRMLESEDLGAMSKKMFDAEVEEIKTKPEWAQARKQFAVYLAEISKAKEKPSYLDALIKLMDIKANCNTKTR